ncbi:hypothetical protein JB92DRAFT_243039 [Gautieria morchelliformis]|nr:hypothetical protein JB92DRAFT_243039 [Gautieria morchelliformis]
MLLRWRKSLTALEATMFLAQSQVHLARTQVYLARSEHLARIQLLCKRPSIQWGNKRDRISERIVLMTEFPILCAYTVYSSPKMGRPHAWDSSEEEEFEDELDETRSCWTKTKTTPRAQKDRGLITGEGIAAEINDLVM